MPTTACTSYYTTTIVGFLPGSGTSAGNVVTFTAPKPDYGSVTNTTNLQCNAVTIGGFNGLNN
jgi:hypothetical protein